MSIVEKVLAGLAHRQENARKVATEKKTRFLESQRLLEQSDVAKLLSELKDYFFKYGNNIQVDSLDEPKTDDKIPQIGAPIALIDRGVSGEILRKVEITAYGHDQSLVINGEKLIDGEWQIRERLEEVVVLAFLAQFGEVLEQSLVKEEL